MRIGAKMAMILAAGVVFASMPFQEAIAQSDEADAGGRIAEEVRRLGDQVEKANRHSESLFKLSLYIGAGIALVAIAGTAINTMYLHRHFSILEKDAKERLRPVLVWTAFEKKITDKYRGIPGDNIAIQIVNAGHVVAIRITSVTRYGMGRDFESGKARNQTCDLGALPPNEFIVIPVRISPEQRTEIQESEETFRVEIDLEYYDVGDKKFTNKIVGVYDGKGMRLK